jgi:hypothetical protein
VVGIFESPDISLFVASQFTLLLATRQAKSAS